MSGRTYGLPETDGTSPVRKENVLSGKPAGGAESAGAGGRGNRGAEIRGMLFALSVTLALLTGIIRFLAGNAGVMETEMLRFAPPERTGLPEAEYSAMAAHITDYLTGRTDSFQYFLTVSGGERIPCFHDYEMTHMADCRNLIRLDGIVCAVCTVLVALSARRMSLRGAGRVLYGLGIAATVMVLWAVFNFDGLFVTFHRIAFRNDYWLLNPRTDLLIRLMPGTMFIDLGRKGLAVFAAGMGIFGGILWIAGRRNL